MTKSLGNDFCVVTIYFLQSVICRASRFTREMFVLIILEADKRARSSNCDFSLLIISRVVVNLFAWLM